MATDLRARYHWSSQGWRRSETTSCNARDHGQPRNHLDRGFERPKEKLSAVRRIHERNQPMELTSYSAKCDTGLRIEYAAKNR